MIFKYISIFGFWISQFYKVNELRKKNLEFQGWVSKNQEFQMSPKVSRYFFENSETLVLMITQV